MSHLTLPLRPAFDYHPSSTVFLLVGEEQEQMLVHASYLSARSEFFEAALSKNWKEGQSRVIKLPEDDPATVAQYLDWCYNNRLPTQHVWSIDYPAGPMFLALARLYVYGERVLDVSIRSAIIENFVAFSGVVNCRSVVHAQYPSPDAIEMVYKGTTATAPIRRLFVDIYVKHGERKWLEAELHPAFVQDVAKELMGRVVLGDRVIRKGDYLVV
jgi:hypothetical protein